MSENAIIKKLLKILNFKKVFIICNDLETDRYSSASLDYVSVYWDSNFYMICASMRACDFLKQHVIFFNLCLNDIKEYIMSCLG